MLVRQVGFRIPELRCFAECKLEVSAAATNRGPLHAFQQVSVPTEVMMVVLTLCFLC